MIKLLRTIAPVMLVIYVSTYIAAPVFAKTDEVKDNDLPKNQEKIYDVQLSRALYSYDLASKQKGLRISEPQTGQPFLMELKVQGKGSQITDVTLLEGDFWYINSYNGQENGQWEHRKTFILQAPDQAGSYILTFRCSDKFGQSVLVTTSIDVAPLYAPPGQQAQPVPSQEAVVVPDTGTHDNTYTVQPVGNATVMPVDKTTVVPAPAEKTYVRSTSYTRTYYYGHPHVYYVIGDWGSFWWGFCIGVVITAIVASAGAAR